MTIIGKMFATIMILFSLSMLWSLPMLIVYWFVIVLGLEPGKQWSQQEIRTTQIILFIIGFLPHIIVIYYRHVLNKEICI